MLSPARAADAPAHVALVANSDFETDLDGNSWPDGWPTLKAGGSWETEGDNHFLRLQSLKPDTTVMLYREVPIPAGVEAIELSWRQRIEGLKIGRSSWFDARIMMEFMDAQRNKVSPNPPAPSSRKDTAEWQEKRMGFLVPERARTLKFMPCLFNVKSGTWDLDDITLESTDPEPLRVEVARKAAERKKKQGADAAKRRAKAARTLKESGSLIPNGNFETDAKKDGWPDHWGRPKSGGSYEQEDGNRFLRMVSAKPGELAMLYQIYDIPEGAKALEMTWRQRVTGLRKGDMPWFDARFLFSFKDIAGKELKTKPGPSYSQRDTDGWIDKRTSFLVPEEALSLIVMPCLFQVKAGTLDIDDVSLVPTDAEPLYAAREARRKMEEARHVPAEKPDKARWPEMLRVVGNRLHDTRGNEVWLQGVNAGGLETLPHDKQVKKSVVVAIDDWKANCVRLPVKEDFWFGRSAYQKDDGAEYRATIDQIVTLAANRGAYIVLDLHRFRAPKQEHADFWKSAAAAFRDHPAVLFDLFNEPHGVSWEIWRNGGWIGKKVDPDEAPFLSDEEERKSQGYESVGMQGLVEAVRSTGARNVIIAGGVFYCNDLSGIVKGYALDEKGGNGIMYSWHTYNWHPGWDRVLPVAAKYPILLGEVGADINKMSFIPAENQEDPYKWVPDMLGFIQKHRINWTGWCLHPKAAPRMILDWNYTPTPFWGEFAKRALAGKQFDLQALR